MCQSSVLPLAKVATTLNNDQGNGYALWQFRVLPERIWMRTSIQDQFLFLQPVYGFLSWHLGRYVRWRILHQQVILLGRYRTGKRVLEKDIGQLGGKMQYARQKSIGGLRMSSVFHLYTTLPSKSKSFAGRDAITRKARAPLTCNEGSTKARIQNEHCPRWRAGVVPIVFLYPLKSW